MTSLSFKNTGLQRQLDESRRPSLTTFSPPHSILIAPSLMTDYLRRIVSGGKARFKDDALNVDLGQSSALQSPPQSCQLT